MFTLKMLWSEYLWNEFAVRTKSLFSYNVHTSKFFLFPYDSRAGIEDSKKWGMLFLVNQLFKIYFKVGSSLVSCVLYFIF